MAKVEEKEKKPVDLGEERTMTPPESQKPVTPPAPPADDKKNVEKPESTEKSEEKKDEKSTDKKEDKKADKKEEKKDEAAKKADDSKKAANKTESSADAKDEQSIAPYAQPSMEYPRPESLKPMSAYDNFDKDNKLNLNTHKRNKKSKTPIRDFIAEACDMKGYKKSDKDKATMSKKLALANVLWMGAKLTVACTVFGPIVGSWLVAQYTNKDKASTIEGKMQNTVKFFTL